MNQRQRLQLDINQASLNRLDALVEMTNSSTRAELVRRALETYDYLLDARARGGRIVLELDDGQRRELVLSLPRTLPPASVS